MAPSAEHQREELEEEEDRPGEDRLNGQNGSMGRGEDDGEEILRMQGGVDTARRETFTGPYFNGDSPVLHKFSPPAFTSLIDLCRDISALQIDDEEERPKSPEITEDQFILLYDEEQDHKEKLRRTSSLKSARTSGQKKIVRFADVLGLDLADVHTFLDEVPRIPKSAFKDLKDKDVVSRDNSPRDTKLQQERTLVPRFVQPGSQPGFLERLTRNKVLLEHSYSTSTLGLSIRGTVRVSNIDYNKHVAIRYSADGWKSFTEIQATYVETPHDGFSDRFGFTIPIFGDLVVGGKLEFAVKFIVLGEECWDNNSGVNYVFECLPVGPPRSTYTACPPPSIALETWGSFY